MPALNELYPTYFLAANAPSGFLHFYDTLYDAERGDRVYLLRGGPGSGEIHPNGVLCLESGFGGAADGAVPLPCRSGFVGCRLVPKNWGLELLMATSPHFIEPKFPGLCEMEIELGRAWNTEALHDKRKSILALCRQEALLRARVKRYMEAVGTLMDDSYRIDCKCSDHEKAFKLAKRLSMGYDDISRSRGRNGSETIRFLSAVTSKGIVFLDQTVTMQCDQIYVLEDDLGAASGMVLSALKESMLQKGYDCILCPSPLAPSRKIDHLLFPSLSLAVCTSSSLIPVPCATERRIHARRFRLTDEIAQYKQHLRFNRRAVEELLKDTVLLLREANKLHGKVEEIYRQCTDYSVVDDEGKRICSRLLDLVY